MASLTPAILWSAFLNGILLGGLYALVALGLTLIFGVMRLINFAHGALMMLAMYASFWLATGAGINPYLALPVTVPLFFAAGYAIQRAVVAPVLDAPEHNQLLLTLGLALFLENLALFLWSPNPRTLTTGLSGATITVAGAILNLPRVLAFLGSLAVAAGLWLFLRRTDLGKALRAAAEEREGALLVGIPVGRLYAIAFGIGTACVAVAGGLAVPFFHVAPDIGDTFVITAFVVVVLGGMGSFMGALLGGLVVGVIESLGGLLIHGSMSQILIFAVFILILLFRPSGLLGGAQA